MVVGISKGCDAAGRHAEVAALAGEFIALGVEFERPIANDPVLWQLLTTWHAAAHDARRRGPFITPPLEHP